MSFTMHVVTSHSSGESSIESDSIDLVDVPGLTGAAALQVGAVGTGGGALFRFPEGFSNDFHNSDPPTTMFVLQGEMEIRTSDGNCVVLSPGDAARFEDRDGIGHRSRALGGEVVVVAVEVGPHS
jgi:hypothetical protein